MPLNNHQTRQSVQLRRLAYPVRTWIFLIVCLLVAALSFGLGTLVRSPDADVIEARGESVAVTAAVQARAVTQDIRIQGEVVGSESVPIFADTPEDVDRAIVTRVGTNTGDVVSNGSLLGAVSDRPIFGLSLRIPLYRDLKVNDSGSDVVSLQEALNVAQTGVLDFQSTEAVRALYASAEFLPPGGLQGTFVRRSEVASLPKTEEALAIQKTAGIGTEVNADVPLITLSLGESFMSVRASVREADQVAIGDEVTIQAAGGSTERGIVTSIGPFQNQGTDGGRPPGRDVRIALPQESELAPGQAASVLFGSEPEPVMAVPTIAIRSDASGDYVLLAEGATRAAVSVLRNADGWSAIDSSGVVVGDQILVSR